MTLDSAGLLDRMGSWATVVALRDVLLQELPRAQAQLEGALSRGEAAEARRLAHGLKSNLTLFEQPALAELARDIELAADRGDLQRAREAWERLTPGLPALVEALRALRARAPT